MSNLNSDQFEAKPCSVCGNQRESEAEYGGQGARGCPACGGSLSPVVGVMKVEPREVAPGLTTVGHITHNGRPVTWGRPGPEYGSAVMQRADGSYVANQVVHYGNDDQARGEGKTPHAAAKAAVADAASKIGKKFRPRTSAERKRINETAKDLGYGSDWERY